MLMNVRIGEGARKGGRTRLIREGCWRHGRVVHNAVWQVYCAYVHSFCGPSEITKKNHTEKMGHRMGLWVCTLNNRNKQKMSA